MKQLIRPVARQFLSYHRVGKYYMFDAMEFPLRRQLIASFAESMSDSEVIRARLLVWKM